MGNLLGVRAGAGPGVVRPSEVEGQAQCQWGGKTKT